MAAIYVKRNKNTHETKIGTWYHETYPSPPNYDTYKTTNPKKKKPTKNCHTGDRIQITAMLSFNDKWQEFVCLA